MAKKEVTKKQHIILVLLYTFRFLNSKQIQEFLRHKDHRRINAWLKELVTKEYIERDFKVVYGILTKPAVYNLSAKGRRYIKHGFHYSFPKYLKKLARDNKASKSFKIRCQLIADLYLTWFVPLQEKNQTGIAILDRLITELTTDTENDAQILTGIKELQFFTSAYFPPFILLEKLKPDAYIQRRVKDGIRHGVIFVLDAYIPRFLLGYTLKRIFDTLDEEYWEDDNLSSLNFYFVCPNNVIITYMRQMLKSTMERYFGSKELTFRFATRNQLQKQKNNPSQKIVWKIVSSNDS